MVEAVKCKGLVKWFSDEKGFGFITCQGHTKDVFVHKSAVAKAGLTTLREGERVSLVVNEGQKGSFASNLTKDA